MQIVSWRSLAKSFSVVELTVAAASLFMFVLTCYVSINYHQKSDPQPVLSLRHERDFKQYFNHLYKDVFATKWDLLDSSIQTDLIKEIRMKVKSNDNAKWCASKGRHLRWEVCEAVKANQLAGPACDWLCVEEGPDAWKTFDICPVSDTHVMYGHMMLTTSSKVVFGLTDEFFSKTDSDSGLKLPAEVIKLKTETEYRELFSSTLNSYLNQGSHEAIINSLFVPNRMPTPPGYIQTINILLSNKRYILSLLFFGTGDRNVESPGTDTESIPAVTMKTYCGGLYQTLNLANHTTTLTEVFHKPMSTWSLSEDVVTLYIYQIIMHLLDIEEATWEHPQEGEFYMCSLNTSQILLENVCVKKKPSAHFQTYKRRKMPSPQQIAVDNACTIKVLDVSKLLYSKFELTNHMSSIRCHNNSMCRLHSCSGTCVEERCVATHNTRFSGLLQICHLVKSVEDKVTAGLNSTLSGRLYDTIDRCIDLENYTFNHATISDTMSDQLYLKYNVVYHEVKLLFVDLHDLRRSVLIREVERIEAEKEARKQKAT